MYVASLIISRYNENNILVEKCLNSLVNSKNVKLEIIFLDQIYDKKIKQLCSKLSNTNIKIKYLKIEQKGISYAKNIGIKKAIHDNLLFFDPDQKADEYWAYFLLKNLNSKVGVCCGKTYPIWEKKPLLISKSKMIRNIYSLFDNGDKKKYVNYFFGGNVAIKKFLLNPIFFDENLGRKDGVLLCGEDIDLALQLGEKNIKILYEPKAYIYHNIQKERISYSWVFKRLFFGGYSKAMRKRFPDVSDIFQKKTFYDIIFLPLFAIPYFSGYIYYKIKK